MLLIISDYFIGLKEGRGVGAHWMANLAVFFQTTIKKPHSVKVKLMPRSWKSGFSLLLIPLP
jgi:hypothetical protein